MSYRAHPRPSFGLSAVLAAGAMLVAPAAQASDYGGHQLQIPAAATPKPMGPAAAGVLRVRSSYGFDETVARLKADVEAKGIKFFTEIDQSELGAGANIPLRPSKLLLFGNPPLGVQFLTSNPYAGLDWPVRMLVVQDAKGQVFVAYTDFAFIAHRYAIGDRDAAFRMASMVSASIASSVVAPSAHP